MEKSKEVGRKQIAELLFLTEEIPEDATVEVLANLNNAVVSSLCEQYNAGIAKPRVEIHGLGVFKMKILPAKEKLVYNFKEEVSEKRSFPKRTQIKFYVSNGMESVANKILELSIKE